MYIAITVIHITACLFLIGIVLLQQGKGADMGAVFGGSSQTLFGGSGAGNFLTRLTAVAAVTFMLTSLTLAYSSARVVTSTVFDDAPLPVSTKIELGESAPAPEPLEDAVDEPAAVAAPEAPEVGDGAAVEPAAVGEADEESAAPVAVP